MLFMFDVYDSCYTGNKEKINYTSHFETCCRFSLSSFIQMISGTNVLTSHPRPYFICGVVAELQI